MRSLARLSSFGCLLLAACGSPPAASPPPCPPPPPPAIVAAPPPPAPAPTGPPRDVHWVRTSAEYRALAIQAYRAASDRITEIAARRKKQKKGSWAVVLDADETILDNSAYQKERAAAGTGFSPESWRAWVERKEAGAIPGAIGFLRRIRELGGIVAIVTNRAESECRATQENLVEIDAVFDILLCKPDEGPSDKQPRWDAVRSGAQGQPGADIVLYVGDNITDFPGMTQETRRASDGAFAEVGTRFIVLPNPMYGSWEQNPPR